MSRGVLLIGVGLLLTGCLFGPSRGSKVLGYHAGRVLLTTGDFYSVGALPHGWREWVRHGNTIRFRHSGSGAMITTSAYCGASFEDLPLRNLMGQLFAGIPADSKATFREFSLDGRAALRSQSRRVIDGIPLIYDVVIVKKNACTFDAMLVAPPPSFNTMRPGFDAFVQGFHYE